MKKVQKPAADVKYMSNIPSHFPALIFSLRCTLATYPHAIKNQRKAKNAPSRGHFVPKPLVGGFGCLELVLYGIRELA